MPSVRIALNDWVAPCAIAIALGLLASYATVLAVAIAVATGLAIATSLARASLAAPRGVVLPQIRADNRFGLAFYYLALLAAPVLVLRTGAGFTVSDALFVLALIVTLGGVLMSRRSVPAPSGAIVIGASLVILGSVASSELDLAALRAIGQFAYLMVLWLWLGQLVLSTLDRFVWAIRFWVLGAALSAGWAVLQALGLVDAGPWFGRYAGLTDHVNDLGAISGLAIGPAMALAGRNDPFRLAAFAALAVISGGLILSGSITGLLAAVASIAIVLGARRHNAHALATGAVLAVGIAAVLTFVEQPMDDPVTRFRDMQLAPAQDKENTLGSRNLTLDHALNHIKDSPLIGTGVSREGAVTPTGFVVHNLFVRIWYEAGLLAFLGIVLIVGAGGTMALGAVRDATPEVHPLAVSLLGAFGAFLVIALAAPLQQQRYAWIPLALVIALRTMQREAASAR